MIFGDVVTKRGIVPIPESLAGARGINVVRNQRIATLPADFKPWQRGGIDLEDAVELVRPTVLIKLDANCTFYDVLIELRRRLSSIYLRISA